MSMFEIVGLGEVLWDLLPAGRQLGGAPFNFVFHCHQLGHSAVMISRVGRDEPGQAIRAEVRRRGLSDECVQDDEEHPTGSVSVTVGDGGQPVSTIHPEVAWDYLAWNANLPAVIGRARAVCFGTLIQRHAVAQATIDKALRYAGQALVICDI